MSWQVCANFGFSAHRLSGMTDFLISSITLII
jgi:hypothetical protein